MSVYYGKEPPKKPSINPSRPGHRDPIGSLYNPLIKNFDNGSYGSSEGQAEGQALSRNAWQRNAHLTADKTVRETEYLWVALHCILKILVFRLASRCVASHNREACKENRVFLLSTMFLWVA